MWISLIENKTTGYAYLFVRNYPIAETPTNSYYNIILNEEIDRDIIISNKIIDKIYCETDGEPFKYKITFKDCVFYSQHLDFQYEGCLIYEGCYL